MEDVGVETLKEKTLRVIAGGAVGIEDDGILALIWTQGSRFSSLRRLYFRMSEKREIFRRPRKVSEVAALLTPARKMGIAILEDPTR